MKWQHVLAAVAEMARQEAEGHPDSASVLRDFADRLEVLRCKRTSRAALAELSVAFDAGVDRVITQYAESVHGALVAKEHKP